MTATNDREYDNKFSEFMPYSEKELKNCYDKNTFQLAILNYEADRLENAPIFEQYQCVIDFKNKGDEYCHSDKTESETNEESIININVKI